jgi:hypothetical protein
MSALGIYEAPTNVVVTQGPNISKVIIFTPKALGFLSSIKDVL